MWLTRSNSKLPPPRIARALTIMELLVVIVIIAILASAILAASSTLISRSKNANTQAVLQVVSDAIRAFEREQIDNPTLTRDSVYWKRYGRFPPDELEVFTLSGIPNEPIPHTRAIGYAVVIPDPRPSYSDMRFFTTGRPPNETALEHRDLAAMILAIEMFSETGRSMLDRLAGRYRTPGPVDKDGDPVQFLDRDENGSWDRGEDRQIRYIVDDWGTPLGYMAQRGFDPQAGSGVNVTSDNLVDWNEVSTQLVRLNDNKPVLFSYGANGRQQLSEEWMKEKAEASMVVDWIGEESGPRRIDHQLNEDNVYANPALKEKLTRGLVE